MRRSHLRLGVLLLALGALLGSAPGGLAAAPPGPRLGVVVLRPYPNLSSEIETVGPNGEAPARVAGGDSLSTIGPVQGDRPAWSPDGTRVAFFTGAGRSPFHVVDVAGGPARPVPGLRRLLIQDNPIFAPDGKRLVFQRLQRLSGVFERAEAGEPKPLDIRVAVWSIGVGGRGLKPLTPWTRKRWLAPISFSPDGRYLAATESDRRGTKAVALDLRTGETTPIARDASEPVYAPDGRIAAVRYHLGPIRGFREETSIASADLLVAARPGAPARQVLRVKGGLASPSWDPSSSRIAFTKLNGSFQPLLQKRPNSVMQVNADGSCLTRVLTLKRGSFGGVAWQPGPGREAGPISC